MAKVVFQQHIPDAGDFFQLFNTTGWNKSYQANQAELQKAIEQSWYMICAYQDKQLVGVGRVVADGVLYAMIYDLIVHPDFQKKALVAAYWIIVCKRVSKPISAPFNCSLPKGKWIITKKEALSKEPMMRRVWCIHLIESPNGRLICIW